MRSQTKCALLVAAVLLSLASQAEAGPFRCRSACRPVCCRPNCPAPCPPDQEKKYGGGTVEQLVTSIAKAARDTLRNQNLDPALRESLLTQFVFQIGPNARDLNVLEALLVNGFVDKENIQNFISGEAKDISNRLKQR
jgi:hypothetical protein